MNTPQTPSISLNPFDFEKCQKQVSRLLKSAEGLHAIRQGLLTSTEGRGLVHSEFGVSVVDPKDETRKPIVAVLIPTHKKPENETEAALTKMVPFARRDANVIMRPGVGSSVVHWVRNHLLSDLYKSKTPFDYVLFIDDDMVPQEDALNVLLSRKVDIIAAVCTVRQDPPLPNARHYEPENFVYRTADIDRPGVWEVGGAGTGFMLISKKALDAVAEYTLSQQYARKYLGMSKEVADMREAKEREMAAKNGNHWWFEFLKHPLGEGEYGEDISFCFKARECGFKIHADSTIQVGHVGNYAYGIQDYWYYREEAIKEGKVIPLDTKPTEAIEYPASDSKMKISILVPTRGRPDNVQRLLDSISTTSHSIPEIVLYVDEDDESMMDRRFDERYVKTIRGPRIILSQCWNECAKVATGDILMHGGDDIIFKTKGWDSMVKDAFEACPDRVLFVHGDDGHWGDRFGTHGFIHRKWMETVGYFVPPHYSSDYNDTHLNEVANALGRRKFLPFITDHMHPIFGKAVWDQTHKDRLERHQKDNVDELYRQKAPERAADAEKLRAVMQGEAVPA